MICIKQDLLHKSFTSSVALVMLDATIKREMALK